MVVLWWSIMVESVRHHLNTNRVHGWKKKENEQGTKNKYHHFLNHKMSPWSWHQFSANPSRCTMNWLVKSVKKYTKLLSLDFKFDLFLTFFWNFVFKSQILQSPSVRQQLQGSIGLIGTENLSHARHGTSGFPRPPLNHWFGWPIRSYNHTIHGTGVFIYMKGWFLW